MSRHTHLRRLLSCLIGGIIFASFPCYAEEITSHDGSADRGFVLRQLRESDLGLEDEVSMLLASVIPDTIAKYILAKANPLAVGHVLRCIPVRNSTDTATASAEGVLFCACTGQWVTSYYTVLGRLGGKWEVLWDTVLVTALPGPIPDTTRLGIETGGWPTLTVSGIMSAKGARQLILIQWDGQAGRVVTPPHDGLALAGDFIEVADLDGDGIMEYIAWVREDARGRQYAEQVFRFESSERGFVHVPGLKSGRLSPRLRKK